MAVNIFGNEVMSECIKLIVIMIIEDCSVEEGAAEFQTFIGALLKQLSHGIATCNYLFSVTRVSNIYMTYTIISSPASTVNGRTTAEF